MVEGGEFGVVGDAVEGGVVAVVTLVFPNVDYGPTVSINAIVL